jgi:hypothetical protein
MVLERRIFPTPKKMAIGFSGQRVPQNPDKKYVNVDVTLAAKAR